PLPYPELPFPVAFRPADVGGFRDGDDHPGLVRAGPDRIGAAADAVCLAQLYRHTGSPAVRGAGRPHRAPRSARRDARLLCDARGHAAVAGVVRLSQRHLRACHRGLHGPRQAVRPRRARRIERRHHAAGSVDQFDCGVAHHARPGAHRGRAERRGTVRRRRSRTILRRDRQPVFDRNGADAVRETAGEVARGRECRRRHAAALAAARPQGRRSHVWTSPGMQAGLWIAFLTNLTAYPFTNGLLPYIAREIYGGNQAVLGYLSAAFAVGSLTGSIILSLLASRGVGRLMLYTAAA